MVNCLVSTPIIDETVPVSDRHQTDSWHFSPVTFCQSSWRPRFRPETVDARYEVRLVRHTATQQPAPGSVSSEMESVAAITGVASAGDAKLGGKDCQSRVFKQILSARGHWVFTDSRLPFQKPPSSLYRIQINRRGGGGWRDDALIVFDLINTSYAVQQ